MKRFKSNRIALRGHPASPQQAPATPNPVATSDQPSLPRCRGSKRGPSPFSRQRLPRLQQVARLQRSAIPPLQLRTLGCYLLYPMRQRQGLEVGAGERFLRRKQHYILCKQDAGNQQRFHTWQRRCLSFDSVSENKRSDGGGDEDIEDAETNRLSEYLSYPFHSRTRRVAFIHHCTRWEGFTRSSSTPWIWSASVFVWYRDAEIRGGGSIFGFFFLIFRTFRTRPGTWPGIDK